MGAASMLVSQVLLPEASQPSLKFNISKLVYITPWLRKHLKHRAHSRYEDLIITIPRAGWYIT